MSLKWLLIPTSLLPPRIQNMRLLTRWLATPSRGCSYIPHNLVAYLIELPPDIFSVADVENKYRPGGQNGLLPML